MPNASTAAARRGWEIFRARFPRASLDELNIQLATERLAPPGISERTYKHYRSMDAHGLVEYMTINEYDQWRKRAA